MKSRGGSITSCLSKSDSSDSLTNLKLLTTQYTELQRQSRKLSGSSNHSSIDNKAWDNSSDEFCRICHENGEEERLMTACRCLGSVKFVHHRCLLNWISCSGELACELCRYNLKVTRTRRKQFSQWRLPVIGVQGWLHIILFFAFLSMLVTSITWVIWSQTSSSSAAVFERTSAEIKYAYLLNGIFILTAVIGISLDSFRQAKKYFQRSLALNQELSIEEYKEDDEEMKRNIRSDYPQGITDLDSLVPRTDRASTGNSKKEEFKRFSSCSSSISEQSVFIDFDVEKNKTTSTVISFDDDSSKFNQEFEKLHHLEETCL